MNSPLLTRNSDTYFEGEYDFLQIEGIGGDDTITVDQQEKIVPVQGHGNYPACFTDKGSIPKIKHPQMPLESIGKGEILFASSSFDIGASGICIIGNHEICLESPLFASPQMIEMIPAEGYAAAPFSSSAAWIAASNIVLKDSTPMDEWESKAAADAFWSEFA